MKKVLLYIFLAILFLAVASFAYAYKKLKQSIQIPPLTEITAVTDIVKPYVDNEMTKGLSIGVYKDGKIEFYNYGICSDENPVLPTENTIYEIGSITKTFTGAVLAEMVTEGKVKYEDPIAKFLPDSVCNWSPEKAITLEELSTHTSGLPRLPDNLTKHFLADLDNPYKNYSTEDMYAFLKKYPSKSKSARKSEYSNLGVGLLGHILAKVDEKSYEAMVTDRIFNPLKMDNSSIAITEGQLVQGHDALGYPTSQSDFQAMAGAGAIRSSIADMMKYLVANLSNKKPYADTHNPRKDMSSFQKIGLAWISQKNDDMKITWHNGRTGGFCTFMGFSKDKNVGVIVMANSTQSVDVIGIRLLQFLIKPQS